MSFNRESGGAMDSAGARVKCNGYRCSLSCRGTAGVILD